MMRPDVSIVLPARNEARNLPLLVEAIVANLPPGMSHEIVIIDDGSNDDSLHTLRGLRENRATVHYVSLARNFGHQAALLAGLRHANGRCVISMDADFQHPPAMLPQMIAAWRDGAEIVLTSRMDRGRPGVIKALTSRLFYRCLSYLSDSEIHAGSADFHLLDRNVLRELERFHEPTLFLRGILPTLGFSIARLSYVPDERRHGRTSYSWGRMIQLGVDGVLSVSIKPLRLGILFAVITALLAILYGLYVISVYSSGRSVPGWASVALIVSVIGAMQLIVLGVIGEYIGRVLRDVRGRPAYIIRESSFDPTTCAEGATDRVNSAK